ncbi:DEAD/DEAH box helicase [Patescibacteria group bacterium]|nr:DEAD/DEAH box helicase [Patescibacteria group bacterium]MBU4274517.1 DEAD/DEAH box helicase [Patescibacteria group bacterium]MBU4367422.1 DEAD/DEAH box helicase [Patescibacteria group bacterium]MBU4461742.1 DEAD/DEAH box helicase [Patescibacteria group bacterium]MCG2700126.1 DEAD/DEAH box helicase [Candidatus Parcubacteria bacterium]
MQPAQNTSQVLIVSITPYFLEKGFLWFKENLKKILNAQKSQTFFQDNVLYLEKDQVFNLSLLLRKLEEMGYEKVLRISEPGEFSQQGGIIDVFPINTKNAVRFDFLGNRIETIELLDAAVEDEEKAKEILKKKLKSQRLFSDLKGLKPGDYLVHLDHGIGKFNNLLSHNNENYYLLEYSEGDKLYVPLGLERKLSRYVGFVEPKVSRLGSSLWQKTKKKIKEGAEKLAKELLGIYAKREIAKRPAYLPNDEFDSAISSNFKYEETPDQSQAIQEVMKDLEKTKPMDRLVCGDVGFGKTEVALRAAVKVVKSGYQTVLIAPTTILADQHFQNIKSRLQGLPIKVALLTRLQSKKEQKKIIEDLKNNKVDILIGTHRILSGDIVPLLFQRDETGLLIIDDEQRFGVRQKEKLTQLRSKIDILSLSATPIPRTLYLSLSSLRDVSLIQTPPEGRLSVKTFILPWSIKIVKMAIEQELKRGGQVYYLHNRVETIDLTKKALQDLLPNVKFAIVHGRMREKELVKIMDNFQQKSINVLIATTIIENGLDIPNVNTLIVSDATRLGLSQAYQIRGRVGRSNIQAFAYFFYNKQLKGKAAIRLAVLKEAEELGSGYRVAMKDLELRGAGNILGKEQSGSINKVGLNLYCQMVAEAVEKFKE